MENKKVISPIKKILIVFGLLIVFGVILIILQLAFTTISLPSKQDKYIKDLCNAGNNYYVIEELPEYLAKPFQIYSLIYEKTDWNNHVDNFLKCCKILDMNCSEVSLSILDSSDTEYPAVEFIDALGERRILVFHTTEEDFIWNYYVNFKYNEELNSWIPRNTTTS